MSTIYAIHTASDMDYHVCSMYATFEDAVGAIPETLNMFDTVALCIVPVTLGEDFQYGNSGEEFHVFIDEGIFLRLSGAPPDSYTRSSTLPAHNTCLGLMGDIDEISGEIEREGTLLRWVPIGIIAQPVTD